MDNFGQNLNYCAAVQGQSIESMGQNHHLGVAAPGPSFGHGMTSAGQDLNHGITALGNGFADLGRYISKSITFLTFALIVRSVVDIGFEYILCMVGMTTLLLLSMWNLQLQASLAHQRRGQRQVQQEVQRTQDAHECAGRLRGELAAAQTADAANEAEKGHLQAELAQAQRKQAQTDQQLEEERMLMLRMSNEITQMRSTHGGCSQGPSQSADAANEAERGRLQAELAQAQRKQAQTDQQLEEAKTSLTARWVELDEEVLEKVVELREAHEEATKQMVEKVVQLDEAHEEISKVNQINAKINQELEEATLTIAFLGGSSSSSAADGCKRRRSV